MRKEICENVPCYSTQFYCDSCGKKMEAHEVCTPYINLEISNQYNTTLHCKQKELCRTCKDSLWELLCKRLGEIGIELTKKRGDY